jgi:hypothetical protein
MPPGGTTRDEIHRNFVPWRRRKSPFMRQGVNQSRRAILRILRRGRHMVSMHVSWRLQGSNVKWHRCTFRVCAIVMAVK